VIPLDATALTARKKEDQKGRRDSVGCNSFDDNEPEPSIPSNNELDSAPSVGFFTKGKETITFPHMMRITTDGSISMSREQHHHQSYHSTSLCTLGFSHKNVHFIIILDVLSSMYCLCKKIISCNNIVNVPPDVLTKPNHLPILLQLSCKL
jgi:hypothetical protein